jgi:hypothetical protein
MVTLRDGLLDALDGYRLPGPGVVSWCGVLQPGPSLCLVAAADEARRNRGRGPKSPEGDEERLPFPTRYARGRARFSAPPTVPVTTAVDARSGIAYVDVGAG